MSDNVMELVEQPEQKKPTKLEELLAETPPTPRAKPGFNPLREMVMQFNKETFEAGERKKQARQATPKSSIRRQLPEQLLNLLTLIEQHGHDSGPLNRAGILQRTIENPSLDSSASGGLIDLRAEEIQRLRETLENASHNAQIVIECVKLAIEQLADI